VNEIRDLAFKIFREKYEPHQLAEAHHVLHSMWSYPTSIYSKNFDLDLNNFEDVHRRLNPNEVIDAKEITTILQSYRADQAVYQRGQDLVDVLLDESEITALYAIQDALRRYVSLRGIVIEVNPSSNLLIANMLDLRNHPILRLFPPEPKENSPPPVRIAIGSDDPITFSTCLIREYSLLYEAALNAGFHEQSVAKWLRNIQRTGMEARFTERWKPTAKDRAETLREQLERYLQRW
jgi:adenosine deaminase